MTPQARDTLPEEPVALSEWLERLCRERGHRDPVIEVGVARNIEGLRYRVSVWPRQHLSEPWRMHGAQDYYSRHGYQDAAERVLERLMWV